MNAAFSVLLLGLLLGVRHATDADHVVAVTTIVARERRLWAASLVGALWGLGHTATVFVVGGAIALLQLAIPPRLALAMDLVVAAMLVALGVATLLRPRASAHTRDDERASTRRGLWRALLVGTVHGLAGSAAIALLVMTTIRGTRGMLVYLAVFGAGTVAGMVLLTSAIALPFSLTARRHERAHAWLARATGLASVALGAALAFELVFARGLLSSAPQWMPR
jgi:high-affinity nickel permease